MRTVTADRMFVNVADGIAVALSDSKETTVSLAAVKLRDAVFVVEEKAKTNHLHLAHLHAAGCEGDAVQQRHYFDRLEQRDMRSDESLSASLVRRRELDTPTFFIQLTNPATDTPFEELSSNLQPGCAETSIVDGLISMMPEAKY